jgi:hypothetical protein
VINDDQEEYLDMIWEDMLSTKEPIKSQDYPGLPGAQYDNKRVNDEFVPNGNAILFKMFSNQTVVSLSISEENAKELN